MPEIDADLFQILTLVLLAVTLAVALAALSAVGKLRKELHSRTAHASLATDVAGTSAAVAAVASDEADSSVIQLHQAHEGAEPEPEETLVSGGDYQSSAAAGSAEMAQDPDPSPEDASSGFGSAESQAAWGLGADADSQDTLEEDIAVAEPQEQQQVQSQQDDQPFEHEGRWYFRRGVELLVYEEATGQWVTAPDDVALASAPTLSTTGTSGSGQTFGDITEAGAVSTEDAAPAEEAGQFWKCPSCGAVNGSTADSCRMCFASKP